MKGIRKAAILSLCITFISITYASTASGETEEKIKEGVYIDSVNVSDMTYDEAKAAVEEVVEEKAGVKVSIQINDDQVDTTLKSLGYKWANESVVQEAVEIGKSGNIIKRYKDDLDLKQEGMKYELDMEIDQETLKKKLNKICEPYNVEAKNASLKATGSGFRIIAEKEGCEVDGDVSSEELYKYITESWDGVSDIQFTASTKITQPEYTTEDCEKVSNTPMGSFYTNFSVGSSYSNRNMNIQNGTEKIDGTVLYPGEQYSCNEHLAPWTEDNGWYPAGTFVGGGIEDSLGGGICQVSSTLYNALLDAEIKVVERYSHSMAVSYVDLAADAALAGDYKDLVFENDTDAPIYVQGIYTEGRVTFNIYGHDTRDAGHSVEYISKTTKEIPIKTEVTKDSSKPKGYRVTESNGQKGYVAELWKVTYEDGVEVDRILLHTSTYAMSPKKVVQGTASTSKNTDAGDNETTKSSNEKTTKASDEKTTKKAKKSSE